MTTLFYCGIHSACLSSLLAQALLFCKIRLFTLQSQSNNQKLIMELIQKQESQFPYLAIKEGLKGLLRDIIIEALQTTTRTK
jgi:hypothetical protein